ncbi:MAG: response regulator [Dehalococcoidia bacterium]|nr:response regulator [Dehalococcoidia bacterium]
MPSVLVIEDEPALRRMLAFTLRDVGFDVRTAWNGADGLEQVALQAPDVIVLDLEMPVMDGRTFYRELRDRGLRTPVCILSAYGARKAQRELSADASVQKPFRADDLIEKLEQLAGRATPRRP